MRLAAALALLCALGAPAAQAAPVWHWAAANEAYFIAPAAQTLRVQGAGSTTVHPWGLGFRGVGGQVFSKTGAVQLQSVKAGKDAFYLLDLLLGLQYLSPKTPGRPLRFTAAGCADLGLSDTTFYAAPVLSAGLLYTASEQAETPAGFTFNLYYRFTDIHLDNAGNNRAGTLRPALGIKAGYIFEGFWTIKDKTKN